MKIIVIRHGETEGNSKNAINIPPERGLSEAGKEQAHRAALLLKNEQINTIYSSDMQRCVETAEAIKPYHPKATITFTPSLHEIKGGSISRLPLRLSPKLLSLAVRFAVRFNLSSPGGESWQALRVRIENLLNELYESHPDATVLLVTHNFTIQAVRAVLKAPGHKESVGKVVPNCGIMRFTMYSRIVD